MTRGIRSSLSDWCLRSFFAIFEVILLLITLYICCVKIKERKFNSDTVAPVKFTVIGEELQMPLLQEIKNDVPERRRSTR
jgi:hypothetical protein